MRKLYVEVGYAGLLQNFPGGDTNLYINGVKVQGRYSNVWGGSGDSTFDYVEFKVVRATFTTPPSGSFSETFSVTDESGSVWTWSKWTSINVPDDFVIPSEFDLGPVGGGDGGGGDDGGEDGGGDGGGGTVTTKEALVNDFAEGLLSALVAMGVGQLPSTAQNLIKTYKLYDTLSTHLDKQFGAMKSAIDGEITARELFKQVDANVNALKAKLIGQATKIPAKFLEAVQKVGVVHSSDDEVALVDGVRRPNGVIAEIEEEYGWWNFNYVSPAYGDLDSAGEIIAAGNHDDKILGSNGNDIISGGGSYDYIEGAGGADVIDGGPGGDSLSGGLGADTFHYDKVKESKPSKDPYAWYDDIRDFQRGEDRIDLRDIDANAKKPGNQKFTFIGKKAFKGKPGELRYKSGELSGDINGDKKADLYIHVYSVDDEFLGGPSGIKAMSQSDFYL